MSFDFNGKKILITGAGKGIGRALALEIAAAGAKVYALSKTKETLDTLAEMSDRIHPLVADLSDWDKTRQLVDELEIMDGVVNNAALVPTSMQDALDCTKDVLDDFLLVNVLGAINIIQSTGKKMVTAGKGGSIVNISSVAGLSPIKNTMEYNISKAALDMVTKQFALELGPHQIRVNTVNFSSVLAGAFVRDWIDTTAGQNFKALTPMGKFIEVKEACGPVMYLLSEQSTMVNGSNQVVDGGLLAHIPV